MQFTSLLSLLFILKCIFKRKYPIHVYIRTKYDNSALKLIRDWERELKKNIKLELDLTFLLMCHQFNYKPQFMKFKIYKRSIYNNTKWYERSLKRLLTTEIQFKQREIKKLESNLQQLKVNVKSQLSLLDYIWTSRIINSNVQRYRLHTTSKHNKKLRNLGLTQNQDIDHHHVVKNYSKRVLSKKELTLLSLGLKFKIPLYKLDYYDYFLKFECIINSVTSHQLINRNVFITSIKNLSHKYFKMFNPKKIFSPLFNHNDFKIIKSLKNDNSIIITRPDKGSGVVILDKQDYLTKMNELLSDSSKYRPLPHTDVLKHIISIEDKLNRITRSLHSQTFNHQTLYTSGSSPGIMYGIPKTHKPNTPLRPVLSAINTPSYKLAKTFIPTLSPLTTNEYTVSDSFTLAELLHNSTYEQSYLTSFDIKSLFTNIPILETIDIIINSLFPSPSSTVAGLSLKQFKKLLTTTVSNSPFLFNNTLYSQTDGMPMGSPLGPTFANIFLSFHESLWLTRCPPEFKPLLYKRYVDDLLIIFNHHSHAPLFLNYLNNQHTNIKFSFETEINNSLPFLDILITHKDNTFTTSVYRKPSNTMLGTNYFSFTHTKFITSPINTFIYRAYKISSSWLLFHQEIVYLKKFFTFNSYPPFILDKFINKFIDQIINPPLKTPTVPLLDLYLKIPYLGKISNNLHKELYHIIKQHLPQCKPIFIPQNPFSLKTFFRHKDRLPVHCMSSLVYQYSCGGCEATYIGHTGLHLHQRVCKHRGLSFRTGQHITNPEHSPIRDHSLTHDHPISVTNFKILKTSHIELHRKILESLYIQKLQPDLNIMNASLPYT